MTAVQTPQSTGSAFNQYMRRADAARYIRETYGIPCVGPTLAKYACVGGRKGEHWQAISAIWLLALTGCRRAEIVNLKWSEVDFANSCLRLGDTKTGLSTRPLPEPARAILADLERQGEFVLPARSRADKSYASVFPKAWLRIIGEDYSPHGLRHAYASAAHELNFGELTIKALLGHARLGVTSGYVARVDDLLFAAADKVGRYIWRSMTGETGKVLVLPSAKTPTNF